tara:strand:+ start:6768 stop:8084 length:1317 start_codon:yes stop_codon:yes gene_type:complete
MKLSFILPLFLALILLITIDFLSIISMTLFLSLGLLLCNIFFKSENKMQYLAVFSFYTIIAILVYFSNINEFPLNYGCTGSEIGGTDDLFFFQEATNNGFSYRGDRSSYMNTYSIILQQVHFFLSIFKTTNLIDLIFVNILFISFIPFFVRKITYSFSKHKKTAQLAFYLAICSSFIMQNSLVLVRDGITASLFIGVFYFLINRKYILLLLLLLGLFYLRIVSGILCVFFIISYVFYIERSKKFLIFILIFSGIFLIFLPLFLTYFDQIGILNSGFFRQEFFEMMKYNASGSSGAITIYSLPYYLRIPLGTLYYIGTPFINLQGIFSNDHLTLRHLFDLFYGVTFLFYSVYLLKAFFIKKKPILLFFLSSFFCFSILFSQISLQIRHKTLIMPLVFIIVALSYYEPTLKSWKNKIVILMTFSLFTLQFFYNLKNFLTW